MQRGIGGSNKYAKNRLPRNRNANYVDIGHIGNQEIQKTAEKVIVKQVLKKEQKETNEKLNVNMKI